MPMVFRFPQLAAAGCCLITRRALTQPTETSSTRISVGLTRCINDRVPVGVLRELAPARHRSQYEVLGLAVPVKWSDGYFFLESLDPPGAPVTDIVSDVLEATARVELDAMPGS
jgi:hypothetical protein